MDTSIKVIVIDDSIFMRKAISEVLASDPQIQVVGTARDGAEGLKKIKMLHPDVAVLDIDMPGMNGLSAMRHIMIRYPIPIVVFSSLFNYGDVTFEALELGCVDFMPKPSGMAPGAMKNMKKQIIDRIKIASGISKDNLRRVNVKSRFSRSKIFTPAKKSTALNSIIAVGAGFSGTNSVIRLVSQLSPTISGAVIALIEMSPQILSSFVEKFNTRVPQQIETVEDGQTIKPGVCYIGSNENAVRVALSKNNTPCFRLGEKTKTPLNTLFKSSVAIFNLNTIGVMLPGLGDDGVDGFSRIQACNGVTIVHNSDYLVHPNLTQNAIDYGVVTHVVDEDRLPEAIQNSLPVSVEYKKLNQTYRRWA